MKKSISPLTYLFAYLLLEAILHFLFPITQVIAMPVLGLTSIALGVGINLWADNLFKKYKTTVKPCEVPGKLVTEGIFRYSRHPMYLGFVLILLGIAATLGSLSPFLAPILMFLVSEIKFIPLEEKNLQEQFGEEYGRYKAKVGRWLSFPGIKFP